MNPATSMFEVQGGLLGDTFDPIEVAYGATVAAAAWHQAMATAIMQFADFLADMSYGDEDDS